MTREMYELVDATLMDLVVYGEGCEAACAACPFRERCHEVEGWWGCGAWEEGMGDDL